MLKAFALVVLAGCVGQTPPAGPAPVDPAPTPAPTPTPPPDPGAGSGSGSGSAAPPMTATQYLHARNVATCKEEFACRASYPAQGASFEQMYGATETDCVTYADAADQPSAVESEIAANHISYSANLASTCLSGTTYPTDCNTYWQSGALYAPSCGAALRGLVADGDPCVVDYDCLEGGSYCEQNLLICLPGNK